MKPRYQPSAFTFFKQSSPENTARGEAPSCPTGEPWTPALYASLWLNRSLSEETSRELIELLRVGEPESYAPGELLKIEPGQAVVDKIAIIVAGRIQVVHQTPGQPASVRTHLRDGHWLGLPWALMALIGKMEAMPADMKKPFEVEAVTAVKVLAIPIASFVGLMKRREDLEAFVATNSFYALGEHPEWRALIKAYDKFRSEHNQSHSDVLKLPHALEHPSAWFETIRGARFIDLLQPQDRHLLLQGSSVFQQPSDGLYLGAGVANDRVGLLLWGEATGLLPGEGGAMPTLVSTASAGSLLGYGELADGDERASHGKLRADSANLMSPLLATPAPRRAEIHLRAGSVVLEFSWATLRWLLYEKKHIWRQVCTALAAKVPPHYYPNAKIYVFYGAEKGRGTTTLAHGGAIALARAYQDEDATTDEPCVCLIDLKSYDEDMKRSLPNSAARRRWKKGDLEDGSTDDFEYREYDRAIGGGAKIRVAWCKDIQRTDSLVRLFREQGQMRTIIVATNHTELNADHNNMQALAERLNALGVTAVLVTENPRDNYSATRTRPSALIRAEYLTPRFIQREREHVMSVMRRLDDPAAASLPQDLTWARHVLRVPYDEGGFKSFSSTDDESLDGFFEGKSKLAQTFERLARMMMGRTVGLALGGGGAWGFTEVALVKALVDEGLPIDYISGTSFGSVVAGLYAAGGIEALDKLLAWSDVSPSRRHLSGERDLKNLLENLADSRLSRRVTSAVFSSHHLQAFIDDILIELFEGKEHVLEEPKPGEAMVLWLLSLVAPRNKLRGFLDKNRELIELIQRRLPSDRSFNILNSRLDEVSERLEVLESKALDKIMLSTTLTPFIPLGTDVQHEGPRVIYHGTVGLGVRSASCLPPAYPSLHVGDARLIDGALIAFVPAGATRRWGADFVVACNVIPTDSSLLKNLEEGWVSRAVDKAVSVSAPIEVSLRVLNKCAKALNRLSGKRRVESPIQTRVSLQAKAMEEETQGEKKLDQERASILLRLVDALNGFYLMSWKAGQDEGAAHANYVIDMQPSNFDIMEFWRGREISDRYRELIDEQGLAASIKTLWKAPSDWLDDDAYYVCVNDDKPNEENINRNIDDQAR